MTMRQIIVLLFTTTIYYSCQKKESKERNTITFNENIDSVRIMLHTINAYLKKLPASAADEPHNYYIEDSAIYINGEKYGSGTMNFGSNSDKTIDFIKRNPDFIKLAYKLNKNGITANIPYTNYHNALFYYRPTFENHRGDSRFIVIIDSIDCNYFGVGNDTTLDRYKDLALIADK